MEIPGYEIEERIGAGGFGEVFRARHALMDRQVAIKVLHAKYSNHPEAVARFVAEARALGKLSHPGIVDVFDFGALADGRQYCVMELVRGRTLRSLLDERGRLPLAEAMPILRQVAAAIDAAHAAGIAHRDLKPDNVFVLDDGGVKLIDFGLAKLVRDDEQAVTATGAVFGTPLYMSPEQCRGKTVTAATDAYSFGVLAYHVLAGAPPFSGESLELALHHLNDDPEPPSTKCPELGARVDRGVLALMAKDPADRPAPLVPAVEALQDGASVGRRRRVWPWLVVGAGVIAAGGALAWQLHHRRPAIGPGPHTIAILQLENRGDADHAWIATGLSEMLATTLRAHHELRVPDANSVAEEEQELGIAPNAQLTREQLAEIRAAFSPEFAVLGAVRPHAGMAELSVRLIDMTGETLADASEDVPEAELPVAAARLASDVTSALGSPSLTAAESAGVRKTWPTRVEAMRHYALGLAAFRHEDHATAITEMTAAIDAEPDFALAYFVLAAGYGNEGDTRAIPAFERAFRLRDGLPERERLRIEAAYQSGIDLRGIVGDIDAAERAYRRLRELDPGDVSATVEFADFETPRDPALAQQLVAAARALPPPASNDPNLDRLDAQLALLHGDIDRCLSFVAKAESAALRTHRPNMFLDARGTELACAMRLGKPDEVLALVDDTLARVDPAGGKPWMRSNALMVRALARMDKHDVTGAVEAARASVAASPATLLPQMQARPRQVAADVLVRAGLADEARGLLAEVHRLCGQMPAGCDVGLLQQMANTEHKLGDEEGRRTDLVAAVASARLRHDDAGLLHASNDLGMTTLAQLRTPDEAIAAARVGAKISDARPALFNDDDHAQAYRLLGTALGYAGKLDEAITARQQALAILKESGNTDRWKFSNAMLGVLQLWAGRPAEAEVTLRVVLADPSRDDMRAALVEALVAQGKLAEAADELTHLAGNGRDAQFARAWVAVHQGKPATEARKALAGMLADLKAHGDPLDAVRLELQIDRVAVAAGEPGAKKRLAELGRDLRARGYVGLAMIAEHDAM